MLGDQMAGKNVVVGILTEKELRLFLLYVRVRAAFALHHAGSTGQRAPVKIVETYGKRVCKPYRMARSKSISVAGGDGCPFLTLEHLQEGLDTCFRSRIQRLGPVSFQGQDRLRQVVTKGGGKLGSCGLEPEFRETLRLMRLDRLLPIYPSEEDCWQALARS